MATAAAKSPRKLWALFQKNLLAEPVRQLELTRGGGGRQKPEEVQFLCVCARARAFEIVSWLPVRSACSCEKKNKTPFWAFYDRNCGGNACPRAASLAWAEPRCLYGGFKGCGGSRRGNWRRPENNGADETWRSGGRRDLIGFSWLQRFGGFAHEEGGGVGGAIWPDGTETVRRSFSYSLSLFFIARDRIASSRLSNWSQMPFLSF